MSQVPLELQAAILGLVQGICEFLPISSSAHLVVLPEVLGWPYLGKAFDVSLHVGTLAALLGFFRQELADLARAIQRLIYSAGRASDPQARLVKLLVIGSVPAAIAGFLLDDWLEPYLQGLLPVALFSIGWGAMLGWADSRTGGQPARDIASMTPALAFMIGCAQATALLPGTSRSGVTLTAALFLGLSRSQAARFSLLLSIPVVAGAALFKGWSVLSVMHHHSAPVWKAIAIGILTSAMAGRLCLPKFLAYLEHGNFKPFVIYRIIFGLLLLAWLTFKGC